MQQRHMGLKQVNTSRIEFYLLAFTVADLIKHLQFFLEKVNTNSKYTFVSFFFLEGGYRKMDRIHFEGYLNISLLCRRSLQMSPTVSAPLQQDLGTAVK